MANMSWASSLVCIWTLSTIALWTSQPTRSMVASGDIVRPDQRIDEGDAVRLGEDGYLVEHFEADAIAAKGRLVVADDRHPSEAALQEAHHFRNQLRIGAGVRDYLRT